MFTLFKKTSKVKSLLVVLFSIVVHLNAGTFQWKILDTLNSPLPSNYITAIARSTDGILWIGTDKGLISKNGDGWKMYSTENSLLKVNHISALAAAENNILWIGTNGGGVYKLENSQWTAFDVRQFSTSDDVIHTVKIHNSTEVWIATDSGSYVYDGTHWQHFLGLNEITHALAFEKNGTVWFGEWDVFNVTGTLSWLKNDVWKFFELNKLGIPTSFVNDIEIDNGNRKWIASGGGLIVYNDTDWVVYTQHTSHLPSTGISHIEILDDQNIWIGTGAGLLHIVDSSWIPYTRFNSPFPSDNSVSAMCSDSEGNVYVGTLASGLVIISPSTINSAKETRNVSSSKILLHAYPNPCNPQTTLTFSIPYSSEVVLSVYDIVGREIKKFDPIAVNANASFTHHLDLSNVHTGVYVVTLKTRNEVKTAKIVLVK